MKKGLYFVFLVFSMTMQAQRSALRDRDDASPRREEASEPQMKKVKKTEAHTSKGKQESKKKMPAMGKRESSDKKVKISEPKKSALKKAKPKVSAPKKAESKKSEQKKMAMAPVVPQEDEVVAHEHRSALRYGCGPVLEQRLEKKRMRKEAAAQAPHLYCSAPEKEEYSRIFYTDIAAGFVKYVMPSSELIKSFNLLNRIDVQSTQVAPLIRAGIGAEFTGLPSIGGEDFTTRGRVGLQVVWAKRKNAIKTLYTDAGSTFPDLRGLQSINRGELMLMGSYDLILNAFSLEGGLGLVGGALGTFSLYQPGAITTGGAGNGYNNVNPYGAPNLIFIGQYLKPNNASFGGFIGFTLAHVFSCLNDTRCELGYRCVFNSVTYKPFVYQVAPDSSAAAAYQTAYANAQQNGPIVLPQSPKMQVRAQEVTFGVVLEF